MNIAILKSEVQEFINKNLNKEISSLVLKGSPFPSIAIAELAAQIEAKKRSEKKLPTWFSTPNIYYPNKLNIEQTSSEATATYKSNLVNGSSIVDITGGFGVDCFAFSKKIKEVTHCELNEQLSEIVTHNTSQLKINNIKHHTGDGVAFVINSRKIYDWIYVDPSRRNDIKGKVFLLKDCLPNIPLHLEKLLKKTSQILIKNSPLLDITSCITELQFVKQVHVIALKNEVKEVLIHVEKNHEGTIQINAINLINSKIDTFSFTYQKEYDFTLSEPLTYLYEPNSAILKSGGFYALCNAYNINKLHQHSHLYTSDERIEGFPGRKFKIKANIAYNKKKLLKLIPEKKGNITTRNFKESVASIRKKTGIKEGGSIYLFFTTNKNNQQIILLCEKL